MTAASATIPGNPNAKLSRLVYLAIHVACLAALWTGVTWRYLAICAGSYLFRIFWMGAGFHRYFAHRSFKTSRPMQFVFAVLGMTGMQRGPLWWAQTHRFHHQHTDSPEDLHSPKYQGFWYSHWEWFFQPKNRDTDLSKVADLSKYPELVWLDGSTACTLMAFAYALLMFGLFGLNGFIWGFCISTVLLWHTVHWIQSFSHSLGGYRRFPTADESRNHWLLGVVSLGEFHNNHHAYPSCARQGFDWWEFDGVYQLLRVMSWLGLVWDLRSFPRSAYESVMPAGLSPATPLSNTGPLSSRRKEPAGKKLLEELIGPAGIRLNGDRPFDIQVHNDALYTQAVPRGSMGLAEAYMDGWWDTGSLDELSFRIAAHGCRLPGAGKLHLAAAAVCNRLLNFQSIGRSLHIRRHYDLGNDLFIAMLDRRMVYSCAYWKNAQTLDEAQEAKLDLVCRKIGARPGMRVLDIGCGFGGFAKFAAERYGVSVTGITISEQQLAYARQVCQGLPVTLSLQDYRTLTGSFDAVVSIGMFEHVGVKNYRRYMDVVHSVLKPEGVFLLHTIGGNRSVRSGNPWMRRYIFPNGMLPSAKQIVQSSENLFTIEDWHNFGPDYDRTAMTWFRNFDASWPELRNRYDERFYRMWKCYLQFNAGTFRARTNHVWQVVFSPKGCARPYESIR